MATPITGVRELAPACSRRLCYSYLLLGYLAAKLANQYKYINKVLVPSIYFGSFVCFSVQCNLDEPRNAISITNLVLVLSRAFMYCGICFAIEYN